MSELRKRELEEQQKSRAYAIAQQKLAAARQIAQLELEAAIAEAERGLDDQGTNPHSTCRSS